MLAEIAWSKRLLGDLGLPVYKVLQYFVIVKLLFTFPRALFFMNTLNILKWIATSLGTCTILVSFSLLLVPPSFQPTDVITKGLSDFLTVNCYASGVLLHKVRGG